MEFDVYSGVDVDESKVRYYYFEKDNYDNFHEFDEQHYKITYITSFPTEQEAKDYCEEHNPKDFSSN